MNSALIYIGIAFASFILILFLASMLVESYRGSKEVQRNLRDLENYHE